MLADKASVHAAGDLLFVNFHHVCNDADLPFPQLHHVTPDRFEAQIDALGAMFDFPPIAAVESALDAGVGLGGPSCVLTFDDGLADHYATVMPILDRKGISGIFSVNTAPWIDRRLLSVHRAHLLSAAFSYLELAAEIETAAEASGVSHRVADVAPDLARSQYRYDDIETARVKYYLNAVIPQAARDVVLERVFASRLGDEADHVNRHYLRPDHVSALSAAGHTIGLHTHRHLHLASAESHVRTDDLCLNRALLNEAAGPIRWISYPYGGPTSYDASVVALADDLGCRFGLTMKRAINVPGADRMRLSRVDNNDVVGGKRPMDWAELRT
ncbi:polysaccharide deacetylase family protein [Rhizobium sp. AG855]|uniref:polysaccharide deacetylase family protein n=1 Tax=Rhizobium sp. AG855 TaxID=2183898 RepID=UPI000E729F67|nr:polysaccharide deacetylase family protein [Rhizobium sp. AG855]RKE85550.1 polysaccharide deacetylase [Rhizobium sp. AG855]